MCKLQLDACLIVYNVYTCFSLQRTCIGFQSGQPCSKQLQAEVHKMASGLTKNFMLRVLKFPY